LGRFFAAVNQARPEQDNIHFAGLTMMGSIL
jgi:hypothetical protein